MPLYFSAPSKLVVDKHLFCPEEHGPPQVEAEQVRPLPQLERVEQTFGVGVGVGGIGVEVGGTGVGVGGRGVGVEVGGIGVGVGGIGVGVGGLGVAVGTGVLVGVGAAQ